MSWYTQAKETIDKKSLNIRLKRIIREDSYFQMLFDKYSVPMSKLDELSFDVKKMHGQYAASNSEKIWLNKKLFEQGDFFSDKLHFVVHELVHWLIRQREEQHYFYDPEEKISFFHSICWELRRGKDEKRIRDVFLPIIEAHFDDNQDAEEFFNVLFHKAYDAIKKNKI